MRPLLRIIKFTGDSTIKNLILLDYRVLWSDLKYGKQAKPLLFLFTIQAQQQL